MNGSALTEPSTAELVLEYFKLLVAVVGAVAWPIALVAIVMIFRQQIGALFARVQALNGPGFGATFSERLAEAREAVAEAPAIPEDTLIAVDDDPFTNLAQYYPEAAVIQAYNEVEQVIRTHLAGHSVKYPNQISFMRNLLNTHALPASLYRTYESLRQTRNAAVHANAAISTDEALEYRNLTRRFLEAMKPVLERHAVWSQHSGYQSE